METIEQIAGTRPLVSVIVPTRNRSRLLGECLEALANQTYEPIEVIVIDDASDDSTPEMLSRFAGTRETLALTILRNKEQKGANASRNRGISASRGSLIAFEDDDCIADQRWIEALVRAFDAEDVGAVTGVVLDPEPRNIYDLAFRGTHRVYGDREATRLVAGNMCVRRELLAGTLDEDRAAVSPDISVSGRGDEEGLFLRLKSLGYQIRVAPDAEVLHVHHYSRGSFLRQAYRGGASAARLGYKYHLRPRPELLSLVAGYLFAGAALRRRWMLLPSALCFGAFAAAALVYNEIWRKKKTAREALAVSPVMTVYYHLRTAGYLSQYIRLLLGFDPVERVRLPRRAVGRTVSEAPSDDR